MIIILFIILGLLNTIEASTTISRRAGYSLENPAGGLIFQSSLSLLSRALIFMFMPILGSMADSNNLLSNKIQVLYLFLLTPGFLIIINLFKINIEKIFGQLLLNINDYGSYFKWSSNIYIVQNERKKLNKKSISFYLLVLIAYIPYYLSWPLIIILLDSFNEKRGLILGLSSVFNGLNTIIITLWIDPRLAKLGLYKNLILKTYSDLLCVRVLSSFIAFLILAIIIYFL